MSVNTAPRSPAISRLGAGWVCFCLAVLWCLFVGLSGFKTIALDTALRESAWQTPTKFQLGFSLLLVGTTLLGLWLEQGVASDALCASDIASRVARSRGLWVFLVVGTMLCCRWQTLCGLNPAAQFDWVVDESQSIAAARTLLVDSRFWISVDMGTHGPVVSGAQTLLPVFGFAIDYAGSRLLGIALLTLSLFSVFAVLRRIAPESTARALLLPIIFVFALLRFEDLLAYNGEHPILFLLAAAAGCAVTALIPPRGAPASPDSASAREGSVSVAASCGYLFAAGVFAGFVPWTKIQGIPLCAALLLCALIGCFRAGSPDGGADSRTAWLRCLALCIGAALPTAAVLFWLSRFGGVSPMLDSYVKWNIVYAGRNKARESLMYSVRLFFGFARTTLVSSMFNRLFVVFALPGWVLWGIAVLRAKRLPGYRGLLSSAVLMTVAAIFCVIKPGNPWPHYVLFLFFPLLILNAYVWAALLCGDVAVAPLNSRLSGYVNRPFLCAYFAGTVVLAPLLFSEVKPTKISPDLPARGRFVYMMPPKNPAINEIGSFARPGERVAIWGWMPEAYNLTGTLPATRTSAVSREVWRGLPMQEHFYQLWLDDFDRSAPPVFVDAIYPKSPVVAGYPNLPRLGAAEFVHEKYPELDMRVRRDYTLRYTGSEGIRVYTRNTPGGSARENRGGAVPRQK